MGKRAVHMKGWLLGTLLCLTFVVVTPRRAEACTFPPTHFEVLTEQVLPSGPLIVDFFCSVDGICDDDSHQLIVIEAGTLVPGTVESLRWSDTSLSMVWTPEAPLSEGSAYEVAFVHALDFDASADAGAALPPSSVLSGAFTVDASREWPLSALDDIEASLGVHMEGVGEAFCCPETDFCGVAGDPCYPEREMPLGVISFDHRRLGEHPFRYRLRWQEADGTQTVQDWMRKERTRAVFQQAAEVYCVTLEIESLIDGEAVTQEHCLDADPDVRYAEPVDVVYDGDPTPTGTDPWWCARPPGAAIDCDPAQQACAPSEVLLQAWCDANLDLCQASGSAGEGCREIVESYCGPLGSVDGGFDDGGFDDGGSGEGGAGGGSSSEGDTGGSGPAGSQAAGSDSGCSGSGGCAVGGGRSSAVWPLILAMLWLYRRRRPA